MIKDGFQAIDPLAKVRRGQLACLRFNVRAVKCMNVLNKAAVHQFGFGEGVNAFDNAVIFIVPMECSKLCFKETKQEVSNDKESRGYCWQ